MPQDLATSKSLRAGLSVKGKPTGWDNVKRPTKRGYSPSDVRMHAVNHTDWQRLRLSLKGKSTSDKIAELEAWWDFHFDRAAILDERRPYQDATRATDMALQARSIRWETEVQVGNYLGALRRGGQLNDDNQIRRAF